MRSSRTAEAANTNSSDVSVSVRTIPLPDINAPLPVPREEQETTPADLKLQPQAQIPSRHNAASTSVPQTSGAPRAIIQQPLHTQAAQPSAPVQKQPLLQPQQQVANLLPAPQMLAFSGVSSGPAVALSLPGTAHQRFLPPQHGMRSPAAAHYSGMHLSLPSSPAVGTAAAQLPPDPTVFQLTDRQVRCGVEADDVSLYAMCRQWVQNSVDVDAGFRPVVPEVAALKLPPPLVASTDVGKDPPKEVALLQDEETLFLDEDTLPAELLMEHHKEHWVMVRGWHQAAIARDLRRWERRLDALLPALQPGMPSPPRSMPGLSSSSQDMLEI